MLVAITGFAEGGTAGKFGVGGTGWFDRHGAFWVPTGKRSGDAFEFECAGDQSNGLGTEWSGRHQQCTTYAQRFRLCHNRRDRFIKQATYIGLIAHKADHLGCHVAQPVFIFHLVEMT